LKLRGVAGRSFHRPPPFCNCSWQSCNEDGDAAERSRDARDAVRPGSCCSEGRSLIAVPKSESGTKHKTAERKDGSWTTGARSAAPPFRLKDSSTSQNPTNQMNPGLSRNPKLRNNSLLCLIPVHAPLDPFRSPRTTPGSYVCSVVGAICFTFASSPTHSEKGTHCEPPVFTPKLPSMYFAIIQPQAPAFFSLERSQMRLTKSRCCLSETH
jgi:hypothetical protein